MAKAVRKERCNLTTLCTNAPTIFFIVVAIYLNTGTNPSKPGSDMKLEGCEVEGCIYKISICNKSTFM